MEHEVKGHTVKAYKVWKDPKFGLCHKIKEIGFEIAIIVVAAMLPIQLHYFIEHNHNANN